MKLIADLHTHSKYSRFFHGKNTIEQMVIAANEIGLKEIAITDHGYKHLFGTNVVKIVKARDEIDEINKWSSTKVLLGIEADIISEDGTLDIDDDTAQLVDVLLIGYHKLIKTDFANFFGGQKKTKAAIQKVTNAYINAIKRYPVTIVTHLDSILKTDLYQIGKACAENDVMVEINNRHCNWTQEQVHDLVASGCMFIVSSDAHKSDAVGEVSNAFKLIEKYDIPRDMIANIELEEHEKTDEDREVDELFSLYRQKQQAIEEKEQALAVKKKTEFTNSLSDEMEDKLREIAQEQGLKYESVKDDEEDFSDTFNRFNVRFRETEELIRQARNFLNEHALHEFDSQNSKVKADDQFIIDQLDEKEKTELSSEIQQIENVQKQEVSVESQTPAKVELSEDEKVLGIIQKKPVQEQAPQPEPIKNPVSQKGAVIVKNETVKPKTPKSTTQNKQSLESFMQSLKENGVEGKKEEPKVEKETKPATKKGKGGVFIQIGDLNDDKNNK